MKRRDFLGTTAGMMLATQFAPAAAPAKEKIPAAILGLGHAHALGIYRTLRDSPDVEFMGICEPDAATRKRFEGHDQLQGVTWLEEDALLGNPDIRMVAVESDVPRLLDLGQAAVEAGKHIHLDKPAGTDLAQFRALLDAADRQDLFVQMGYMFRYNPGFDFIRKMVAEGALGDIYSIHASMFTDLSPAKRAELTFHPGGIMLELGCHLIDMIVLLMGAPEKVTPFLRQDTRVDDGLNDNALAVMEFEKAIATVETAAREPNAFAGRRFRIVGTNGTITLSPLEPPAIQLSLREAHGDHPKGISTVAVENRPRYVPDIEDLAAAIRGERKFDYPSSHDYAVQRALLQACGESV